MDEEQVVGPLTLKQFLCLSGGVGIMYLAYSQFSPSISIPLIMIAGCVTFLLFKRVTPPPFDQNYISAKRYQFAGSEEYQAWLQRKIAIVDAQIAKRARKGFVHDPALDNSRELLDSTLRELLK